MSSNALPRSTPEAQGIASSAIQRFVDAVEAQVSEVHSFMLLRHGQVVAEAWWSPYGAEIPHMLFSLSKSFTSTAIGLAVAEGRLSIDDPVIGFFPDALPNEVSENLAAMRVRHLLGMTTGHATDTMPALGDRDDGKWTRAFLECPVEYAPGTHFLYNTGATYMLSAILQKVTGERLLDYLMPRLMEPLGIENATWELSPEGIHTGGFGLSIRTEDIAKFGQLYLQKGVWNGKPLVPESWVELATSSHISNGSNPSSDWEQGYGFQFWRCRHNAYRGDGAFGQYCVVMPEQDAVLASTGGLGDMQVPLTLVWEHLLPAMREQPLPEDSAAHEALTKKLTALAYVPPQGAVSSPLASRVSGRRYEVEDKTSGVGPISLRFDDDGFTLSATTPNGDDTVSGGYGVWRKGTTSMFFIRDAASLASGVWTAEDTFSITARLYETPFVQSVVCRFEDDRLNVDFKVNVSFGPTSLSLTARAAQPSAEQPV